MVWAGRDDLKDYVRPHSDMRVDRPEIGRAFMRHVPTGLEIWGALNSPYFGGDRFMRFQFGLGQSGPWLLTFDVAPDGVNDEIQRLKFPHDEMKESPVEIKQRFRKQHGYTYRLTNFNCVPPDAVKTWTPEIVHVLLRFAMIYRDLNNFLDGQPAMPDRIIFDPPSVPPHLHTTLENNSPEVR